MIFNIYIYIVYCYYLSLLHMCSPSNFCMWHPLVEDKELLTNFLVKCTVYEDLYLSILCSAIRESICMMLASCNLNNEVCHYLLLQMFMLPYHKCCMLERMDLSWNFLLSTFLQPGCNGEGNMEFNSINWILHRKLILIEYNLPLLS